MENIDFITYEKAISIIKDHPFKRNIVSFPIEKAGGCILAETFIADRDFPPFDRVTMDGIAIQYSSYAKGQKEFKIASTVAAGSPQSDLADPTQCIEIMTGAILPLKSDTVIPYENITVEEGKVTLKNFPIREGQNIHFRGSDLKAEATLVTKGSRLSSAEISIAAAIGKSHIKVEKLPSTVIISTGDELVDINETPQPYQIRRSNVYGIQNTLNEWGIKADLKHLSDNVLQMESSLKLLLEKYDVLILTGGVSKGKYDYLPQVLVSLGVKKQFHKIQQRPGKPFWFGTTENNKRIFALPGNPVSSFVCLYSYIKKWFQFSLGLEEDNYKVVLDQDLTFEPDLTFFKEAKIKIDIDGTIRATPLKGNGSGDFTNLVNADGFLKFPQNKSHFKKGEYFSFISFRNLNHLL
ncbi:MAG: molybdopterin molybdotransferase MoeA [Flavobacteriaceae bacterium]|jgi:molybdopterin molybdotransferase